MSETEESRRARMRLVFRHVALGTFVCALLFAVGFGATVAIVAAGYWPLAVMFATVWFSLFTAGLVALAEP